MFDYRSPLTLLGDISAEQFLNEYWQKKPLLIRQAIPNYLSPIDPDELAGLAMEEIVESRIIIENGESGPWELKRGPFEEEDFGQLPESHWTLLIQQLDAWCPEINELKRQFQFIPNWRIDDIMASYAPVGGSVGPHFDHYDVFLLQAYGKRSWRIGQTCTDQDATVEGTPLSILEQFKETENWVLEPGDMLYLPPKLAHFGVAEDDCITLSVGFRAPKHDQLISHFADFSLDRVPANSFYQDPDLRPQDHCGEISQKALSQIKTTLEHYLSDETALIQWFGSYQTESKNDHTLNPPEDLITLSNLTSLIDEETQILVNEGSRFAYHLTKDVLMFFVDGKDYSLNLEHLKLVQTLCEMGQLPANQLNNSKENSQIVTVLLDLLNQGSLYFSEE